MVFSIIALEIYREILNKYRKRAIAFLKITFLKILNFRTFLEAKRNFVPKEFPISFVSKWPRKKYNLKPNLASLLEKKGNNYVIFNEKNWEKNIIFTWL